MGDEIAIERMNLFLGELGLSKAVIQNYKNALQSSYIKEILIYLCKGDSIFEITDLKDLWEIYSFINLHPKNISSHRVYSAAIMRYIRFLNGGEKIGKRIDYHKPKTKKMS